MRRTLTLALAAGLVLAVATGAAPAQAKEKKKGYGVGDTVADFTLPGLDAKKTSLKELAKDKKLVVLDFWSITCPYCVGSEEAYVRLHKKHSGKGVRFIHINSNRTENRGEKGLARIKKTVKEEGIPFPVLIDEGNDVADRFGAAVTPTVYILDADDLKVVYTGAPNDSPARPGRRKRDYIDEVVSAKLAGKKPPLTSTRAKG